LRGSGRRRKRRFVAAYKSRCFAYYGPGDVRVETREVVCGPTDIVIRVDVCGRCGTDRRLFTKAHPRVKVPTVLGHELVGRVVEVGAEVRTLTDGIGYKDGERLTEGSLCPPVGRRITVQSRIARYRDGLMLMRDPIQNLSFQIPAAFAQYMRIPAEMIRAGAVLPVPDHVSDEEAALTEPAACALESIFSTPHATGVDLDGRNCFRAGIRPGGRTLIIGSGTLAMIYACFARKEGAREVWLMVRSAGKAALIGDVLGDWPRVKVVPDYAQQSLNDKLKLEAALEAELATETGSDLFDDVVLACPSLDAQRLMFRLLNPDGYAVAACFAGLNESSEEANVDQLHYRIAKCIGTSGCSTRSMETVLRWLGNREVSFEGFVCPRRFTLDDDPEEFFQTPADGRKPMLYPWG
jgi:L-iditol 2-dehydrogenase